QGVDRAVGDALQHDHRERPRGLHEVDQQPEQDQPDQGQADDARELAAKARQRRQDRALLRRSADGHLTALPSCAFVPYAAATRLGCGVMTLYVLSWPFEAMSIVTGFDVVSPVLLIVNEPRMPSVTFVLKSWSVTDWRVASEFAIACSITSAACAAYAVYGSI